MYIRFSKKHPAMKRILLIIATATLFTACGDKEEKKKDDSFEINRTQKEPEAEASEGVPVDMDNVGIGPIKELVFPDTIDEASAARGKTQFEAICIACHMVDQRMIGPAMQGVYERRNPAWVMNIMLNPDEMLQKDPIAIALLKEYNNAIMLNQNLTEEEARDLAEYLRTL